ncbi:MAG: ABC transporter ATP-binding protein [Variibacter sp.]
MSDTAVIEARDLIKDFGSPRGALFSSKGRSLRAVDHVSFAIPQNHTLALVGESGCGKTTTARLVLMLEDKTAGELRFRGKPLDHRVEREYRGAVQAVFQDPWSSLNPRMRVETIVGEPLRLNTNLSSKERALRVAETLEEVGLDPAMARNFPHEFSGGQRQRIAIARAIILRPQAIILDEPVSALDVSVRLQIVNLLVDTQRRLGMSYLLISHDLATVRYQADTIAVMYRGAIVEQRASETVFNEPLHPYTQLLFEAARFVMPGSAPQETAVPAANETIVPEGACRFSGRCPAAMDVCRAKVPPLRDVAPGHAVACHLHT